MATWQLYFDPVLGTLAMHPTKGGGGGGGSGGPAYETFTGPSNSVTLSGSPSIVLVEKNGVEQHNDGIGIAEGMYKLSGNTLTVHLAAGDILDVYEWFPSMPTVESFMGPASSVTLSQSPSIVIPYTNGVQLHPGSGLTVDTFKLSGNTLTVVLGAGDVLDVYEWA